MAMVKAPFNGQLNSNEIFTSIYNMIISQQVFADNIAGTYDELVTKVKTDGTLYGDTKLFYATDCLKSREWGADSEAPNLLNINRPDDPQCQAIVLDQWRQIDITVDDYLSKRAWGDEGAFSSFQSVILGWIRTTKRIYEATLINSYMGTVMTAANKNEVDIDLTTALTGLSGVEKDKKEAMTIAEAMANLFVDLKDISREYNDYHYLRSYNLGDLYVVWNSAYVNKIRKVDLPTIFHKDGLMDKFEEVVLPSRYFGDVITSSNVGDVAAIVEGVYTPGVGNVNGTVRSMVEKDYVVSGTTTHCFPGDELPAGYTLVSADYGKVYVVDEKVICKVFHNQSVKFMSAFEVGTSFFNPRSLTTNHYLTWGYSHPDYLKNYPIIKIEEV
jgi:hypothetical protein